MFFLSKYSNIKLGGPNEKPEYSDMSWFAMLMAAGMTNGIMLYSVFEPVHHYTSRNKYSADPTTPDNEIAQSALMVSFFHLGLYQGCNGGSTGERNPIEKILNN